MHEESLFGDTPPAAMADDVGSPVNLGYRVSCNVDGWLRAFRYYGWSYKGGASAAGLYADHWGALWNPDGSVKLFVPFERTRGAPPPAVDEWRNKWIHPKVRIEANVQYTLSVWMYRARYGYTPNLFDSTYVNGHLTVFRPSEGSPAGRYRYFGDIAIPDQVSSAAYAVDLVVEVP